MMTAAATPQAVTLKDYFAREGGRFSHKDAQRIGPILEKLGPLCNKELVEYARPVDSPLHQDFEWDDNKAGEYYRRLQASDMVRSIRVRVVTAAGTMQEICPFQKVSVTTIDPKDERKDGRGKPLRVVVPIEEAAKYEQQKMEVLERARQELLSFRKRYSVYRDVFAGEGWNSLFVTIDQIVRGTEQVDISEAAD